MTASEDWAAVAAAVQSRMNELGIHEQVDLVRRAGLSDATVRVFMTGKLRGQPPREDSRTAATAALGSAPGSIDEILNRGAPELSPRTPPDRLAVITGEVVPGGMGLLVLTDQQFAAAAYDGRTPTSADVPKDTFNRPSPPAEDGDHIHD